MVAPTRSSPKYEGKTALVREANQAAWPLVYVDSTGVSWTTKALKSVGGQSTKSPATNGDHGTNEFWR